MKTFRHFWRYLAKFFLEWEMFQTKVVEKIKTHILCSITFFRKSHRLWDNVEKCNRDRGATNTSQHGAYALRAGLARLYARMRMHTRTRKHAHTQTTVQYLLLFHSKSGYVNAPHCYVIRTLPVFFFFAFVQKAKQWLHKHHPCHSPCQNYN
jgi:hypothetical protein